MSTDSSKKKDAKRPLHERLASRLVKKPKTEQKRWGPISAVLVTLGLYFGAQVIGALLLTTYADIRSIDIQALMDESAVALFVYFLIVQFFTIVLLWQFMKSRGITAADIGLKRPTVGNILLAVPTYGVYFIILIAVIGIADALIPSLDVNQRQQTGFDMVLSPVDLALVFIAMAVLPPVIEEIVVRGFLYGGLMQKFSKVYAALIASSVFAVAHLQLGSGAPALWIAAIDTFILSMVLIWLREQTGNIYAGMVVHFIKNSIAYLAVFIFAFN